MAWPPVSLSSDQNAGFLFETHSESGATVKPSLFRLGICPGRSYTFTATNLPVELIRKIAVRPLHVSSHTAQRSFVSRSKRRSITPVKPLATVATRVKLPVL